MMSPSFIVVKQETTDKVHPTPPKRSRVQPLQERMFVPAWLSQYEWLRYDGQRNLMYCDLCVKYNRNNVFTEGCQNFRRDNLNKHVLTGDHKTCSELEHGHASFKSGSLHSKPNKLANRHWSEPITMMPKRAHAWSASFRTPQPSMAIVAPDHQMPLLAKDTTEISINYAEKVGKPHSHRTRHTCIVLAY